MSHEVEVGLITNFIVVGLAARGAFDADKEVLSNPVKNIATVGGSLI